MHHDTPTYLSATTWAELLAALKSNEALRLKLGVKPCPLTGQVEEHTMADRLGGMLNVWPAKWREIIEGNEAGVVPAWAKLLICLEVSKMLKMPLDFQPFM